MMYYIVVDTVTIKQKKYKIQLYCVTHMLGLISVDLTK